LAITAVNAIESWIRVWLFWSDVVAALRVCGSII